ncbi:serine hydrolase domain-containing protein [Aquimarina spongiae]|nr:serine hydrolase domain-containing protein [Aquimarina spongiae]
MKIKIFSLLLLSIFIGCNFKSKEQQSIDEKIKKALIQNNVPSLSIGLIKNGKIELVKGFGFVSRTDSSKVNENSIFQIASQSKMFTGIIANNLIQEGRLNLNTPITEYLPKEAIKRSKKTLEKIKLRNLLTHTSGIPSDACSVYRERIEGEAWLKGYPKDRIITDLNQLKLEFEPNSKFQYSNSGYAIVGFICEYASGLMYEELLKKYITDKYHLDNTVVDLSNEQKSILVTPYKKSEREIQTKASDMGMATPASAIFSNVTDLTNILSKQILAYRKKEIQNPLYLTLNTSKMDEGLEYGFGLIKETKGKTIKYGHGGDADGFACEYFFNPTENTGIVVLTSSGGRWVGQLANEILESIN